MLATEFTELKHIILRKKTELLWSSKNDYCFSCLSYSLSNSPKLSAGPELTLLSCCFPVKEYANIFILSRMLVGSSLFGFAEDRICPICPWSDPADQ